MHEFSIALSIVEIAEQEAKKAGATNVERIDLEIGTLSGVEIEALEFAWDSATKGTILQKAERTINVIDGLARCQECDHEYALENIFDVCPKCNSYFKETISGKELLVKSLVLN